jgi:glycosyltransferase involved in cell wall biosynthesis
VIFLNRFFHPDHSASSQMLSDLAFGLAARGYSVAVITSRQVYDDPAQALPSRELICGVDVHRVWACRFGRRHLVGRSFDYLSFLLSAVWRLRHLVRADDVVVTKTDPPMLSVLTVPVARRRRAWAVNWLQDVFPEVAEQLGLGGRLGCLAYPVLRQLRNRSLRLADANVVLGGQMADRVVDLGMARARIAIIPNWADGASVVPILPSANALRRQWGLEDRFVVGYSGNLGRAHDIDTLLEAIRLVGARARPALPITWLFIGGGGQLDALRASVPEQTRGCVRFEPYQPRERLAESLSVADVHLVSLRPELEGLIVPSKFYGVAAAGRPTIFIGDSDGEIGRIVADTGSGLCVAQGDGAGLAEAVMALATDPKRCRAMGEAARRAFEADFDVAVALARWQELIERIATRDTRTMLRQPDAAVAGSTSATRNAR